MISRRVHGRTRMTATVTVMMTTAQAAATARSSSQNPVIDVSRAATSVRNRQRTPAALRCIVTNALSRM
jgi:hypothetical protein